MKIKFPTSFSLQYSLKSGKYYYHNKDNKLLVDELLKSSNEYCMYCGRDLRRDGELDYNLEHSIEKSNDTNDILKHCKYNLSVSCPKCNQVFKKRMISDIKSEISFVSCPPICCSPCNSFKELWEEYILENRIILQPRGIKTANYDEKYNIRYNLTNFSFEPYLQVYSQGGEEDNFIREHIARFHLNRDRKTLSVNEVIDDCIEYLEDEISIARIKQKLENKRYQNRMGEEFKKEIIKNFNSRDKLKEFLKVLIVLYEL